MRLSYSSWTMRRVLKGLTALTLGATTWTLAGCISPPGPTPPANGMTQPNAKGQANSPAPANGTAPANGIVQASATMPATGPRQETVPGTPLPPLPPGAPLGLPTSMCTYWSKEVQWAPDPLNNGQTVPCLVGQLLMFDAKYKSVLADGMLTVTLVDEKPAQGGPPVALENWVLDKVNLRKLICKDEKQFNYWGYRLPMPTATYRPGMTTIRMDLKFQPEKGDAVYVSSGKIEMHPGNVADFAYHTATVPAPAFHPAPTVAQPPSQAGQMAQQLLEARGLPTQQLVQPPPYQSPPLVYQPLPVQGVPQQQYQGQPQYQGAPPAQMPPQQYQGQPQYQGAAMPPQQYQGQPQYQGAAMPQQFTQPQPYQGAAPQQQALPANGNLGVPAGAVPVNGGYPQRSMAPQLQYQNAGQ